MVRIGVDALLVDVAWNALWNRTYYSGEQTEDPLEFSRNSWSQTGIIAPANVFLYQLDLSAQGVPTEVYFGSLPLTDSAEFAKWAHTQPVLHIQQDTLGTFLYSEYILAVYDANRVYLALSPQKNTSARSAIRKATHTLMASEQWTTVEESSFRDIRKLNGDLVSMGTQQTTIEFKNGQIRFSLVHPLPHRSVANAGIPQFPASNTASFWMAGLPSFLAGKTFQLGPFVLAGDSLLKYDRGNLMLEWKGTVMQQDTVISYDYDDNFEMQERKALIEKPAPEVYLSIAASNGLSDYLRAEGILTAQGVSREVMPLYQIGVNHVNRNFLQLHTAPVSSAIPKQGSATDDFLYLRVRFEQIDSTVVSPLLTPYLQLFDTLEATGKRVDGAESGNTFGTLFMCNTRINSLVQLVNTLENTR